MWKLEFFVKKCNMYEAHIFPRPLQQTCTLETTPWCLNTRLIEKKIQILTTFIEINLNVCPLCDHHAMNLIIFHTQSTNCQ